jgi:hypothetical protein
MSRSPSRLRHTLFGALFTGCLAFGSAQAFATPQQVGVPIPVSCNPYDKFSAELCSEACAAVGYDRGYCARPGGCRCLG